MKSNIEISFYMEKKDFVDMDNIAKILNIENAGFCAKGELCTSNNKKVQYISDVSYYGFGIKREVNELNRIEIF